MSAVRHFGGVRDVATVPTRSFSRIDRAVRDVADRQAMGVVHGVAGTGKTFGTQAACGDLDVETISIEFPKRTSQGLVLHRLLYKVAGIRSRAERRHLLDPLLEALGERPLLLKVDEAQNLSHEVVELLRFLHDDPDTTFGLLLVGGNGCWELLRRFPMLESRITRRVEVLPITADKIVPVLRRYHALYAAADPDLLRYIDANYAVGLWRSWAAFTRDAVELCTEHQRPLDRDVAHAVFALHRGVQQAA